MQIQRALCQMAAKIALRLLLGEVPNRTFRSFAFCLCDEVALSAHAERADLGVVVHQPLLVPDRADALQTKLAHDVAALTLEKLSERQACLLRADADQTLRAVRRWMTANAKFCLLPTLRFAPPWALGLRGSGGTAQVGDSDLPLGARRLATPPQTAHRQLRVRTNQNKSSAR